DDSRCGPAFIKRVEISSWSRGVLERVVSSRARRSLKGAKMLQDAGFSRPSPLAALEIRTAGAVRASYLLSEPLDRAETLSRFALGPHSAMGRDYRRRKRISDVLASEIRRLHDAGLYTRDMQETNLMIEENGAGGYKIHFIDLEDFRRARAVSWRKRMLNLVHLDRSIGRFLCRAARLDFLYAYLGRRPPRAEAREIVSEILALRARIERRRHGRIKSNRRSPMTHGALDL
ncbi:MAG TPA: lipopolysaccharide kinase InaA family protein, partial [Candidatus Binataceae bacterium]